MSITLAEAKANLETYIEKAAAGEEIVITDASQKPLATIKPAQTPNVPGWLQQIYDSPKKPLIVGLYKDQIKYLEPFDASDREIERMFNGE